MEHKFYSLENHGTIELLIEYLHPLYKTEDLFTLGLRHNNSQRSFLFVSKILGKHIPIKPATLIEATRNLSILWLQEYFDSKDSTVPEPVLVIGFAETATAMAHSFFTHLQGDVSFLHSTRENPLNISSAFYAHESHSHATDHHFFLSDKDLIKTTRHVLVIDDEITSGKTALNLIRAIDKRFPGKNYSVASFLDWRNRDAQDAFDKGVNGDSIKMVSLLRGRIIDSTLKSPNTLFQNSWGQPSGKISWKTIRLGFKPSPYSSDSGNYVAHSGRFGITKRDQGELDEEIAFFKKELLSGRSGRRTLFLGQGECMYIPLRLALEAGPETSFHATTRSPAWPCNKLHPYGIKNGIQFCSVDGGGYSEYIYNILDQNCDELFLVTESVCHPEKLSTFMQLLYGSGIKDIKHVILAG